MPNVKPATPPHGKPRMQSQTDRDMSGLEARAEREAAQAALEAARAIPTLVLHEEITAQHDRELLDPTAGPRVARLETRVDNVVIAIGRVEGGLQGLAGEIKGLATLITEDRDRDHLTFTTKIDVDRAQAASSIKVHETDQLAAIASKTAWGNLFREIVKTAAFKVIGSGVILAAAGGLGAMLMRKCGG